MKRFIFLLLCCVSLNAQSITVSGTTYKLTGNEIKSDPNTYLHQFIEDAGERGYDFSGVVGSFEFFNGTGGVKGRSFRVACLEYDIDLDRSFWNEYDSSARVLSGANNLYEQRRHLIYHELGHALLNYAHVCNGEDINGNWEIEHDIMFAVRACVNRSLVPYVYTWRFNWENQVERLFNEELHFVRSCSSSSSKGPIYDY